MEAEGKPAVTGGTGRPHHPGARPRTWPEECSSAKEEVNAVDIKWTDGFCIRVKADQKSVTLSANREGLLSLAGHLRALAESPPGTHIHYDEFNSLEAGSTEWIIEKTE